MAIAYVQGVDAGATTAATVTTGALTTTSANAVIITATGGSTGTPGTFSSVTDSKGNTYSLANSNAFATLSCDIWYSTNITGGASHTWTGNYPATATVTLVVQEFSGIALSSALDQVASNASTSPNASSGNTPTTTVSTELVIGAINSSPATNSVGAGYSNIRTNNTGSIYSSIESQVVSSTGAYAANFINVGTSWVCLCATFKAANTVNNANMLEVF